MLVKLIKALFIVLICALIIDPADKIFHLKTPVFLLILLIWGVTKVYTPIRVNKDISLAVPLFIVIGVIGVCSAFIQHPVVDFQFAMGFIKSFSILLLLFVIYDYQIHFDELFRKCTIIVPIVTITIYGIFLYDLDYFLSVIFPYWNTEMESIKFAQRNFYGVNLSMFYFQTSALLVFPLSYYTYYVFDRRKNQGACLFFALLFFFTLILSGTRANIGISVLILLAIIFYRLMGLRSKIPLLAFCFSIFMAIFLFVSTLDFSEKDSSLQTRSGHIDSYKDLFNSDPQYLLLGQGVGSLFYTSGFGKAVPQTEFTYFEFIRMLGIPLTLIVLFLLLYPVYYLIRTFQDHKRLDIVIGYSGYLIIAGSNPLIISSTGMVAIMTAYSFINRQGTFSKVATSLA